MPPQTKQTAPPPTSKEPRTQKGKRKPKDSSEQPGRGRKKRKTKGKGRARVEDSEEEALELSSGEDSDDIISDSTHVNEAAPRRSGRARKLVAGGYTEGGDPESADDPIIDASEDVEMIPDTSLEEPVVKEEDDQDITLAGPPIGANSSTIMMPSLKYGDRFRYREGT